MQGIDRTWAAVEHCALGFLIVLCLDFSVVGLAGADVEQLWS